ncbi:hypothetical protein PBY51_006382 [Eleginops maclovinus]|uniref:Uncharacterized protein n=1 Tax=Eleginops maclovinus TaxID=56733 RepID=A0AAN7X3A7_ELEMC|nr:hypothetical protein PBY51_006382 [Eleginops maclovinus]
MEAQYSHVQRSWSSCRLIVLLKASESLSAFRFSSPRKVSKVSKPRNQQRVRSGARFSDRDLPAGRGQN